VSKLEAASYFCALRHPPPFATFGIEQRIKIPNFSVLNVRVAAKLYLTDHVADESFKCSVHKTYIAKIIIFSVINKKKLRNTFFWKECVKPQISNIWTPAKDQLCWRNSTPMILTLAVDPDDFDL